jgi:hypothetical protein
MEVAVVRAVALAAQSPALNYASPVLHICAIFMLFNRQYQSHLQIFLFLLSLAGRQFSSSRDSVQGVVFERYVMHVLCIFKFFMFFFKLVCVFLIYFLFHSFVCL